MNFLIFILFFILTLFFLDYNYNLNKRKNIVSKFNQKKNNSKNKQISKLKKYNFTKNSNDLVIKKNVKKEINKLINKVSDQKINKVSDQKINKVSDQKINKLESKDNTVNINQANKSIADIYDEMVGEYIDISEPIQLENIQGNYESRALDSLKFESVNNTNKEYNVKPSDTLYRGSLIN